MIAIILGAALAIVGLLLVAFGLLVVGAKICKNPFAMFILGVITGKYSKTK